MLLLDRKIDASQKLCHVHLSAVQYPLSLGHTHAHTNTHTHTHKHIHITHTHTHIHIHIHKHKQQMDRHTDTLIIINNHWTISLVVPGFSSKWTIHRNLSIVGSQSVSMSVIVGEETTLGSKYYSLTQCHSTYCYSIKTFIEVFLSINTICDK